LELELELDFSSFLLFSFSLSFVSEAEVVSLWLSTLFDDILHLHDAELFRCAMTVKL
jgi:hypothetical protein